MIQSLLLWLWERIAADRCTTDTPNCSRPVHLCTSSSRMRFQWISWRVGFGIWGAVLQHKKTIIEYLNIWDFCRLYTLLLDVSGNMEMYIRFFNLPIESIRNEFEDLLPVYQLHHVEIAKKFYPGPNKIHKHREVHGSSSIFRPFLGGTNRMEKHWKPCLTTKTAQHVAPHKGSLVKGIFQNSLNSGLEISWH